MSHDVLDRYMQIQHKDTGWSKHKSERLLKQAYLGRGIGDPGPTRGPEAR